MRTLLLLCLVSFSIWPQSSCPDSTLFPQGKWNWLYTEVAICQLSSCNNESYTPSDIGDNYSYVFSNDSVYVYRDMNIRFISAKISYKNSCNHILETVPELFIPLLFPGQINVPRCIYSLIGDTILCLEYIPMPSFQTLRYYFVSDGALAISNEQIPNRICKFNVNQSSNKNIHVLFELSRTSDVCLTLYSISGKVMSTLLKKDQLIGKHEYAFRLPLISNGCYIFVLKHNNQFESVKFNYVQ
jgi:hypothetical protein